LHLWPKRMSLGARDPNGGSVIPEKTKDTHQDLFFEPLQPPGYINLVTIDLNNSCGPKQRTPFGRNSSTHSENPSLASTASAWTLSPFHFKEVNVRSRGCVNR
jgi:hypothetical protein